MGAKMKILVGSFQCESNTFCSSRANKDDFEIYYGQEVVEKLAACKVFEDAGAQIVPLLFVSALPSGMVEREAFDYFRDLFIERIQSEKNITGIYLYLHGSMYVEGMGSGEEGLVKAIREEVGAQIPISTALDFHGNLSDGFIQNVNAIQGFRTAPHVDQDDTERRAAKSLLKCIKYKKLPTPCIVRIPFLGGDASITDKEPFLSIASELDRLDQLETTISCAFFNGQPWLDSEYTGNCAVVAVTDQTASPKALQLAKIFWEGRKNLTLEDAMKVEEAVDTSLLPHEGILFVTDSGDNTTAGAPGEGTLLLSNYCKKQASRVLLCGILEKQITDEMLQQPIGTYREVILQKGKCKKQEVEVKLLVTLLGKGKVYGWAGDEVGEGVILQHEGITIVLTNARAAFTTPEHFKRMGIIPQDYKVIVLKMGYLFPKLRELSDHIIFALTPGVSSNDFEQLDYVRCQYRMYPICQDIRWEEIVQSAKEECQ